MFDAVVIGAGVVGLAIARELAVNGRSVVVLERHGHFGEETSSRNSEVIHAGLYYPPGSLKARLCVAGRQRLLDYCERRQVPYRLVGKWILAGDKAGEAKLSAIQKTAWANGVELPEMVGPDEVRCSEPLVACRAGLFSPGTGIIDSHALMNALLADLQQVGGILVGHHFVERIERSGGQWSLSVRDSDGKRSSIDAPIVVNAAGIGANRLARSIVPELPRPIPALCLVKGSYFVYSGRLPIKHLLYPTPEPGGLGIHLTMDLAGNLRFGPDVQSLVGDLPDYRVDERRHPVFVEAIQRYLPGLEGDRLSPGYAGVRPKLNLAGEPVDDFMVETYSGSDWTGLVNLFGIESPGLTACLALAEEVRHRLVGQGVLPE